MPRAPVGKYVHRNINIDVIICIYRYRCMYSDVDLAVSWLVVRTLTFGSFAPRSFL